MKNLFIIALLLIAGVSFGQKVINKPLVVLDTTFQGVHSIYEWDGTYNIKQTDSTRQVGDNTFVVEPGYFSLQNSYIQIPLKKTRIYTTVGGEADTIYKSKHIQIQFMEVWKAISDVYGNQVLKNNIKKTLKPDYKNKISQE